LRFPAERGIAGSVLNNRTAERVDDPASDPRFYSEVDRRTGVVTTSVLAAPLIAHPYAEWFGDIVHPRGAGLEQFRDLPRITAELRDS
jgi:hypothetical protein